ncbi:hypothetical protein [Delftia acidovorans]
MDDQQQGQQESISNQHYRKLVEVVNRHTQLIDEHHQKFQALEKYLDELTLLITKQEKMGAEDTARIIALSTMIRAIGMSIKNPREIISNADALLAGLQVSPFFLVNDRQSFEQVKKETALLMPPMPDEQIPR